MALSVVEKLELKYPYLKGHPFLANKRSGACVWCGAWEGEHPERKEGAGHGKA